MLALQKALADEGFYKAGLDGIIGGQTLSAARQYALDKNLPAGSNYVPIEVVKSLDLTLYLLNPVCSAGQSALRMGRC